MIVQMRGRVMQLIRFVWRLLGRRMLGWSDRVMIGQLQDRL
jgi:hypothetical protein